MILSQHNIWETILICSIVFFFNEIPLWQVVELQLWQEKMIQQVVGGLKKLRARQDFSTYISTSHCIIQQQPEDRMN